MCARRLVDGQSIDAFAEHGRVDDPGSDGSRRERHVVLAPSREFGGDGVVRLQAQAGELGVWIAHGH